MYDNFIVIFYIKIPSNNQEKKDDKILNKLPHNERYLIELKLKSYQFQHQ